MSLASAAAPSKWAPLIALTSSSFGVKSALGYADHWHTDLQLSATPASLSHVEEKNNSTVSLTEEHSTEVCTPSAECELCPHGWRVSVERDDEKIKGEFEACEKYERRQKHVCTLFYGELLVCLVMDSMRGSLLGIVILLCTYPLFSNNVALLNATISLQTLDRLRR